jgi:pimeloyl-ACP methyl ester carboxylesterase
LVHFGATLTKPGGSGPFPAVIIISGSGAQDRDGSMFGHKPYAVLADFLTRNGIAVLRVDDRGIGKTSLGKDFKKLTSADFAEDVETGMAYLQSRSDVSKKKIGLVGHSEGGMIAPMVAAKNKDVAFIVLLAGPGQKGADIWNFQMQRAFERPGLTGKDKQLADDLVNTVFEIHQYADDPATVQQGIKTAYDRWKKNVPDSTEKRLLVSPGSDAFLKFSNSLNNGLSWLRYFLNYDPTVNLSKIKIPVLAVNGEDDIQISANENLTAIEAALKKGGNKKYTIKTFPHLNHLFQTTTSKEQAYGSIEETFSPEALNFISQWIMKQVQ